MALTLQSHARRQQVIQDQSGQQNRLFHRVVNMETSTEVDADSAPTITIYDPNGDEVLAAASMTKVSGSDSSYYYDLDTTTTTTWLVQNGYRAKVIETVSSQTFNRAFWIDVVYYKLESNLVGEELWAREAELEQVFATNRIDHGVIIWTAWDDVIGEIWELMDDVGDEIEPDTLVGSNQLHRWHLFKTLELIFGDLDNESKEEKYAKKAEAAKSAALASAARDATDTEDPDVDNIEQVDVVYTRR